MKEYSYVVKVEWSGCGIEAKNKEEAIEKIKDSFYDEYGIKLSDEEIMELEASK